MNIERPFLAISFVVSYLVAVISTFWLSSDGSYNPLIVALISVSALAATAIEILRQRQSALTAATIRPSPLTPDSRILSRLMQGAIETVCRGVSVPQTPETADLRAFIFQLNGSELVCSHYWAPNPVQEEVGLTKFNLERDLADKIAVVRAALDKRTCRTAVEPIANGTEGISGNIDPELNFVLATPILNRDGSIWGVVDFDSGNDIGKALLQTSVSDSVMYHLAEHLRLIFSLSESVDE